MFARMRLSRLRLAIVGVASALTLAAVAAQETPPPAPPEPIPAPTASAVAATVNGHPIPELSVYRGLLRENPVNREQARKEILIYLIDNLVVDQYLTQLKIQVEAKEVDERVKQIKQEAENNKQDFAALMKRLHLTEEDLRSELTAALRWDKFVIQQGTDKVLADLFAKNKNMFDGSMIKARHILIPAAGDNAKEAVVKLTTLRKQIEDEAAKEVANLPPTVDALAKENERQKALDKAFASLAQKESTCPSKKDGGNLGWFQRVGAMVEPFARAAFALKPYEMSEAVTTEFGYHLIMATDQKPGKEVKFEDARPFVLEVYGERLREAIITTYKARSKIVINPPAGAPTPKGGE